MSRPPPINQSPPVSVDPSMAYAILDLLDESALLISSDDQVAWITTALERLLDIDRDRLHGGDAPAFVKTYLAPRISDERCSERVLASLVTHPDEISFPCIICPPDGKERSVLFASRKVPDGPFRGMRLIRLCAAEPAARQHGAEDERHTGDLEIVKAELVTQAGYLRSMNVDLETRNAMLETILANLSETVNILDRDLRFVYTDTKFARSIGLEPEDMIGRTWEGLGLPMSGAAPYFEDVLKAFATGSQVRGEVRHVAVRDIEWSEYITTPLAGPSGATEHAVTVARDVSERKRMEETMRESEEKYRSLVELSADAILIHRDGRITYINPAGLQLLGATSIEDVRGMNVLDIVHPDHRDAVRQNIQCDLLGGATPLIELQVLRFDGQTVPVEGRGALTYLGGAAAVQVVMRDVTLRKREEERLQRYRRKLEEAHHEANLYLDIMTHDIRNTNNVSVMYAGLLVDLLEGDLKIYALKLLESIQWSTEILRNVATIRRIHQDSAVLSAVRIDSAIRCEIDNRPDVSIRYDGESVQVWADSLLSVVFTNLLDNAVKFGGSGVEIAIRIEKMDGMVRVTVADTGPGVPDDLKEAIFNRFERGKRQGRGEGLGLFICRTLIERYGGSIWVEDRVSGHPEQGAAITFMLAEAPPDAPGEPSVMLLEGRDTEATFHRPEGFPGTSAGTGRRGEESREHSENEYRLLFDRMLESVILYEIIRDDCGIPVEYRFMDVNAQAERAFGRNRDELIGKSRFGLETSDMEVFKPIFDRVVQTGEPEHHELYCPAHERYLEVMVYRPRYDQLAMIAYDITDRKRIEELKQQAYSQIEKNIEQFAILGDHIRHPLQVIMARADLLGDAESAERIHEQVRRINGIIKQLDQGWVESREIQEFLRRNDLA
jgi:PAS domain S-box-containing protein